MKHTSLTRWLSLTLLTAASTQTYALQVATSIKAAQATATSNAACTALTSFYWEIGDRNGILASGSRGSMPPKATAQMAIYSAGKWIDAAYVVAQRGGVLSQNDIRALTMSAGYTADGQCLLTGTVADCQKTIGKYDAAALGKFAYGPGHFQKLALDLNLGKLNSTQLATDIVKGLGNGLTLSYAWPQLAGGARSSASDYAIFLRKILKGELLIGMLGANAVCTYTGANDAYGRGCPTALSSPASNNLLGLMEAWHYSIGHWVEDDPVSGDGAFSSAGAGGFYPWIDANKQYYGILARAEVTTTSAADSVKCGRLIRKAWLSGTAPASETKTALPNLMGLLPK